MNSKYSTVEAKIVTIVFMGDSITAGQYIDSHQAWTGIITDELTRYYLNTPVNIYALARGVSGETTRQGLERFPADVQNHFPDIVTLQFGLNDCNCWVTDLGLPRVSEDAYRANLTEMIVRCRQFGAQHIILGTNHQTLRHKILPGGESLEERRKKYNHIVREVAASTQITLCDIALAFDDFSPREMESLLMPYPDHLHLSSEGHKIYAGVIGPFVHEAVATFLAKGGINDKKSNRRILE